MRKTPEPNGRFTRGAGELSIIDTGQQGGLVLDTDELLYRLAVFEQDEGRYAAYRKAGCEVRAFVHIDLADRDAFADRRGQLFQDGELHPAWAAPGRPEIDEGGPLCDGVVERLAVEGYD